MPKFICSKRCLTSCFLDADFNAIGSYNKAKLRHTNHAGTLLVVKTHISSRDGGNDEDLIYKMDVNQVNSGYFITKIHIYLLNLGSETSSAQQNPIS
jgi:hypothetical protein